MDDDLPILGGPPAVELANTWYGTGPDVIDFLDEVGRARRWVSLVVGEPLDDLGLLRELRDAVRSLVIARSDGGPVEPRAVETVNRHAAAAVVHLTLVAPPDGRWSSKVLFRGPARLRAQLATSCIEVLTGPDAVRRCEGPGCPLFFVQDHGRRRFCHDGCSHRARQQRYRRKPQ